MGSSNSVVDLGSPAGDDIGITTVARDVAQTRGYLLLEVPGLYFVAELSAGVVWGSMRTW